MARQRCRWDSSPALTLVTDPGKSVAIADPTPANLQNPTPVLARRMVLARDIAVVPSPMLPRMAAEVADQSTPRALHQEWRRSAALLRARARDGLRVGIAVKKVWRGCCKHSGTFCPSGSPSWGQSEAGRLPQLAPERGRSRGRRMTPRWRAVIRTANRMKAADWARCFRNDFGRESGFRGGFCRKKGGRCRFLVTFQSNFRHEIAFCGSPSHLPDRRTIRCTLMGHGRN
jgi:hypothetical protein